MQRMNQYTIVRSDSTPDWDDVPALCINCKYDDGSDSVKAYGQICCDESAILIHLWAEQREIRAEERGLLGMPCKDSCLEFFFCPNDQDIRYINMEFNINKCLYLGIGSSLQDLSRIVIEDADSIFKPQTNRTPKGWEIYFQIPYSFVQRFFPDFFVFDGKVIRANCYTCSESSSTPYNLSWNRIQGYPLSFHRPQDFGTMKFRIPAKLDD